MFTGPNIITDGLVLYLDAANTKKRDNSYYYKWWVTSGSNPTTKSGFDSLFTGNPQSFGITYNESIDWVDLNSRPSYITPTTFFSWEVTGFLFIDVTGDYIFNTRSDDGNELQINDQIVTSFYGGRGVPTPGDISSTISLTRGYHKFQYRMQQGSGGAGAQVRWQIPGSSTYEVIPSKNFAVGLDNNVFVDLLNQNDGLLINGPTFNSDFGGIIQFDGVDDYIETTENTTENSFTVTCWVFHNGNVTTQQPVVSKWFSGGLSWMIDTIGTNILRWLIRGTTGGDAVISTTITPNTWLYVSTTYQSGSGNCSLHINGNLISTGIGRNTLLQPTNKIQIGRKGDSTGFWLNGNISQVKIYNRPLSSEEILQNYNATKSRYGL